MQYEKRQTKIHEPVLVSEVVKYLKLDKAPLKYHPWPKSKTSMPARANSKKRRYIDATVGTGGHSIKIIQSGGEVLGIDADLEMLSIAKRNLEKACPTPNDYSRCFKLVRGNFRNITSLARQNTFDKVDGVLLDLGISNVHYKKKSRGFSFSDGEALLDMRLNKRNQKVKASDLLNSLRADQLRKLFEKTLYTLEAKKLADLIIKRRSTNTIQTVGDLLSLSSIVIKKKGKIHPATRVFLALRIAVNSEIENLIKVLPQVMEILRKNGRLAVISFHSGEDAIVKKYYKKAELLGKGIIVTKKPVLPSKNEISGNPKARSAKLRVFEKL